jgi:hypothetical protein
MPATIMPDPYICIIMFVSPPQWHWRRGRAKTRYQRPEATQRAKSVPEN